MLDTLLNVQLQLNECEEVWIPKYCISSSYALEFESFQQFRIKMTFINTKLRVANRNGSKSERNQTEIPEFHKKIKLHNTNQANSTLITYSTKIGSEVKVSKKITLHQHSRKKVPFQPSSIIFSQPKEKRKKEKR
ncbi:MAG: hypothetical protein ACTSWY_07845 [Promethearchaeota archaeon]